MTLKQSFFLFFLLIFCCFSKLKAQEFRCQVSVNSQQIKTTDKKVFDNLQTALYDFVNSRKWTNYTFKPEEKIDCSISIIITEQSGRNNFKAQVNIQSRRPVYNSNYTTTLFNYMEPEISFIYDETTPLEFSQNTFYSNLSSTVAFYLYFLLGLDFDSFSSNGGTPFYTVAQSIVQIADKSEYKGWKASESNRNKYWLVENYTNPVYQNLREANYKYHRLGLDLMSANQTKAREGVLESLRALKLVNNEKQSLFAMQLFVDAKVSEIGSIFAPASDTEKNEVLEIFRAISPINANKLKTAFEVK